MSNSPRRKSDLESENSSNYDEEIMTRNVSERLFAFLHYYADADEAKFKLFIVFVELIFQFIYYKCNRCKDFSLYGSSLRCHCQKSW